MTKLTVYEIMESSYTNTSTVMIKKYEKHLMNYLVRNFQELWKQQKLKELGFQEL